MILLVGSSSDRVLKYFGHFLIKKNKEVVFLNQANLLNKIQIYDNHFSIGSQKYFFNEFTGVLNRIVALNSQNQYSQRIHNALKILSYVTSMEIANVLNPLRYSVTNDSKLYQITNLKLEHIAIPTSTVLAKTNIFSLFQTKVRYIFKSLSSIRSIVKELDPCNYNQQANHSSDEPVLFQELLHGLNIRVHIIKNECVAVSIQSSKIDYRYDYGDRKFQEYKLPLVIKAECISIAKQLKLNFCGIDLIKAQDTYYIFEVNPSPGYSFYEQNLPDNKISYALMKALIR